jgi:carboxymethylenebutenolidase
MAIKGEWIRYEDQMGYFAFPEHATGPLPAIMVIQEIGGVNEHIMDVTRRLAAAGYAALAPDLFSVNGERLPPLTQGRIAKAMLFMRRMPPGSWMNPQARETELAKIDEPDRSEISETFAALYGSIGKLHEYLPHLHKAVKHLRKNQEQTKDQKVACVGFCMGGGLSALLACEEPELSGAAVFYGSTPPSERISSINCPVISFYGGNDQRINAGIPVFEESFRKIGRTYDKYVYDGANHAFFNDDSGTYNVKAVRDSYVRLLSFFFKVLSD